MCLVAGRDKDASDYGVFKMLLSKTETSLRNVSTTDIKKNDFWQGFEQLVYEHLLRTKQEMKLSDSWSIDYLENSIRFPDIVAFVNETKGFGIEVKTITSQKTKWKIMGGSIMESTRVPNVDRIHVLCAKKADPIQIMSRKFEDCVVDVTVTHSPRYILDMLAESNIFEKLHINYNDVREMTNPFAAFKDVAKYSEGGKKKSKKSEEKKPWWDLSDEVEYCGPEKYESEFAKKTNMLIFKFWKELDKNRQDRLIAQMFVSFPEVLCGKYDEACRWLAATENVICKNMRDKFSASGQKKINKVLMPQVYTRLKNYSNDIVQVFKCGFAQDSFDDWRKEVEKIAGKKTDSKHLLSTPQLGIVKNILDEIEANLHH